MSKIFNVLDAACASFTTLSKCVHHMAISVLSFQPSPSPKALGYSVKTG